jgi:formylglycine-generating enzyme
VPVINFATGNANGLKYSAKTDMGNKPVNFVTFYDSIRFANWLHNGQGSGDTETGAYTLADGESVTRNAGATWFLASESEWYKAAYHDPRTAAQGGPPGDDNYWLYPTSSDNVPNQATANAVGDISNPGVNVANYLDGADWNGQDGNLTTVGSAGPLSARSSPSAGPISTASSRATPTGPASSISPRIPTGSRTNSTP